MDLQTALMIKGAGDQLNFVPCKDDDGYYGMLTVNHPTPSGADRWLPAISDNRRFPDSETAVNEFKTVAEPTIKFIQNEWDLFKKKKQEQMKYENHKHI